MTVPHYVTQVLVSAVFHRSLSCNFPLCWVFVVVVGDKYLLHCILLSHLGDVCLEMSSQHVLGTGMLVSFKLRSSWDSLFPWQVAGQAGLE